MRYRQQNRF